jgi:ketosteroid isomerase-like protein
LVDRTAAQDVIVAMFAAHGAGRVDEFLSLIHPEVLWQPSTRPARPFYLGREGTVALLEDMATVYGDFYVQCQRFTDLQGGRILVRGLLVRRTTSGEEPDRVFQTVMTVRDNLIARLEEVDDETASTLLSDVREL